MMQIQIALFVKKNFILNKLSYHMVYKYNFNINFIYNDKKFIKGNLKLKKIEK